MHILIVYAHQEQHSFSCALKDMAVSVLEAKGHSVEVSDLYAQHFNPVASRDDFTTLSDTRYINYMLEQRTASEHGFFSEDIRTEQEKVLRADLIMFHFPIWWFSAPAMLKGWFDRVFATGVTWNFGHIYDGALLKGKKAMLVVTTGGGKISTRTKEPTRQQSCRSCTRYCMALSIFVRWMCCRRLLHMVFSRPVRKEENTISKHFGLVSPQLKQPSPWNFLYYANDLFLVTLNALEPTLIVYRCRSRCRA